MEYKQLTGFCSSIQIYRDGYISNMHSGQSLLLLLDTESLILWNMHSGQFLLLISDLQSWIYRTCTVGSLCSSFGTQRVGSEEHAQWAASAPHFRYTELDI